MTLELARSCSGYVTTIINNTDVVPTVSPGEQHLQPNARCGGMQIRHGDLSLPPWGACPAMVVECTLLVAMSVDTDIAVACVSCCMPALEDGVALLAGAADALREEVVRSAWYEAFRADMRSNIIVRAVESSLGGVGSATTWTTSRLATASQGIM